MFQFPGFAFDPYGFRIKYLHLTTLNPIPQSIAASRHRNEEWSKVGFPIRKSPDQSLFAAPRRLIAAYHVLHRLSAPRHPPNALKALDRSHYQCPPLGSGHAKITLADDPGKDGIVTKRPEFACRTCPNLSAVRQKRSTQPDKPAMVCTRTLGMGNPRFEHVPSQR